MIKEMIEKLRFFINQLSFRRVSEYTSWRVVGCIIFNFTHGSEEGNRIWHEFSQRNTNRYNKAVCDKKWEEFRSRPNRYSIGTLIHYIHEDGGTFISYQKEVIVNGDVNEFVYDVLLPKLSIRRMRNRKALNNLCSALYHMSAGKDRDVMIDVCKRIKDDQKKEYFIMCWDEENFKFQCGVNDIIKWVNHDEKEKPKPKPCVIKIYKLDDLSWIETTKNQLKFLDDNGYKPYYLKGHLGKRSKKKL